MANFEISKNYMARAITGPGTKKRTGDVGQRSSSLLNSRGTFSAGLNHDPDCEASAVAAVTPMAVMPPAPANMAPAPSPPPAAAIKPAAPTTVILGELQAFVGLPGIIRISLQIFEIRKDARSGREVWGRNAHQRLRLRW